MGEERSTVPGNDFNLELWRVCQAWFNLTRPERRIIPLWRFIQVHASEFDPEEEQIAVSCLRVLELLGEDEPPSTENWCTHGTQETGPETTSEERAQPQRGEKTPPT